MRRYYIYYKVLLLAGILFSTLRLSAQGDSLAVEIDSLMAETDAKAADAFQKVWLQGSPFYEKIFQPNDQTLDLYAVIGHLVAEFAALKFFKGSKGRGFCQT